MRKLLLLPLAVLVLASCEYIPDYKFSASVPVDLLGSKYGEYAEGSATQLTFLLDMGGNGTFLYEASDEPGYDGLLPDKGVYTVTYSHYGIDTTGREEVVEAAGTIVFRSDDSGDTVTCSFNWECGASSGEPELTLSFEGGRVAVACWMGGSSL